VQLPSENLICVRSDNRAASVYQFPDCRVVEVEMVFSEYAQFYDLYYANKDYSGEVDFVLYLASKFGLYPETVLDMGCGTGKHLIEMARRGLTGLGFDQSPEMLKAARNNLGSRGMEIALGDLRHFRTNKQYDLVVAMFAVMGYLTSNEDLLSGLLTARDHLTPNGLFIFDGWFGPAVLAQRPEERIYEYTSGTQWVQRKVTPFLNTVEQVVSVHYEIISRDANGPEKRVTEDHKLRYMFVQEMKLAMQASGLALLYSCPFMKHDGQLSPTTWNVSFVACLLNSKHQNP